MRDVIETERLADLKFEGVGKLLPPALQPGASQLGPHVAAQAPFGGTLCSSANENGRQALADKAVKSEELRPFDFSGDGFGRVTSRPPVMDNGLVGSARVALALVEIGVRNGFARWKSDSPHTLQQSSRDLATP